MNESRLLRCGLHAARALAVDELFEISPAVAQYNIIGADCASVKVWRSRSRLRYQPTTTLVADRRPPARRYQVHRPHE